MVCAWCIALIAVCAMALVVKVTNAQPGERKKSIRLFTTSTIIGMNTAMKMQGQGGGECGNHRKSSDARLSCKRQHPASSNCQKSFLLCSPRLRPSGPRNILHSSICPKGENITRISFSLHFLDIIPINNFLSSTAKESKDKEYYQQIWAC